MKAVVWQGPGEIEMTEVPDPALRGPDEAIVRLTVSAICGTDLHMIRGTLPGMKPGQILGHEGVGVVEEVGSGVRAFRPGDRVVIPSTLCCGVCSYCRAGYTSQCDRVNPNGPLAGTAFYGGPQETGPFDGLQAQYARIPFASANLVPGLRQRGPGRGDPGADRWDRCGPGDRRRGRRRLRTARRGRRGAPH